MIKFDPDTGQPRVWGSSIPRSASLHTIREVFSGEHGDRLMSEISQDSINRGRRVPITIRVMRHIMDRETHEATLAAHNVEELRKKRLWREKSSGVITEAEYQKQLREGSIV